MKSKLTGLPYFYQLSLARFKTQQAGVVAVEYAIILATLTVLLISIVGDGSILDQTLLDVWQMISDKTLGALNSSS